YYRHRGYIVLFDRHFFADYFAHDIVGEASDRPRSRRIHGYMLQRFYPQPDLVIFLDAPPELLFARKGEGTVALLERRRQEYLQLRDHVRHFCIVDATQPVDEVVRDVASLIQDFYGRQRGTVWGNQENQIVQQ
ncbi:MAG: hypothetical protein M3220_13395, partial [Chloroflexota bacterium]|nr:hypothetical protein [Chloroflexota bacterium]